MGYCVSQTARHLAKGKQKITKWEKSSSGIREMSWNGSTVEAIAFNPRPNCNDVLLDRSKRPDWDCDCGVERTLR